MELIVYNSEKFQRSKLWYLLFSTILVSVIVLSVFTKNQVGVVVLFALIGAYFYFSVINSKLINVSINKNGLLLGDKNYPWAIFTLYVLEIDVQTQKIKNIVFVTQKGFFIHTIKDSDENIKNFVMGLNEYLPMLKNFEQNTLDKISRRFKL